MNELDGNNKVSAQVINDWLNDKTYLLAGLGFATLNMTVSHLLGIPADFHTTPFSLVMSYVGIFLSGFTCGMGLLGIVGIIVLYLKFSPNLQYSLNPEYKNPLDRAINPSPLTNFPIPLSQLLSTTKSAFRSRLYASAE